MTKKKVARPHSSSAPSTGPRTWPRYTGDLKKAMSITDDIVEEVPRRLEKICELYGIDQNDPLWERRLLMTVLHRHVEGFEVARMKRGALDEDHFIDIVDQLMEQSKRNGSPLPSKTIIGRLQQSGSDSPEAKVAFAPASRGYLETVYSNRNSKDAKRRRLARESKDRAALAHLVKRRKAFQDRSQATSHAVHLMTVWKQRNAT